MSAKKQREAELRRKRLQAEAQAGKPVDVDAVADAIMTKVAEKAEAEYRGRLESAAMVDDASFERADEQPAAVDVNSDSDKVND